MCGSLEVEPARLLSVFPGVKVAWDYGWGLGGVAIKDSPAHLLEADNLAPVLSGLSGEVPGSVSFLLLLARAVTTLADLTTLLGKIDYEVDWEPEVLGVVGMIGFSHEGAMYSIKARQADPVRFLDRLTAKARP